MAAKNVVADLTRGEKLTGNNYDIWHRKIQYLLNEQELLETLSSKMTRPEDGNTAQHRRDLEAYQSWFKKDRSTRFTMLSSIHDDLIREYEAFQNAKDMWDQLKFDCGGTSITRLRSLVLKFEVYRKDPKHTMTEHLRIMSGMICGLKVVGNVLTDEQQVQAATKSAALIAHGGQRKPNGFKNKDKGKVARQGGPSTNGPKVNKGANQHKRDKCSAKKNISKVKYYNCNKLGHFARDCTEPKKVSLSLDLSSIYVCYPSSIFVCSHVFVAKSISDWIIDTGATRHVARDQAGFVDYRKIPAGTHVVYMGNGSYEEALGVGKDRMTRLAREGLLDPLAKVDLPICEPCLAGKACRKPFAEVENQHEKSLKALRTDRGREYLSDQFKDLCEEKGIRRQLTISNTPQQNGVAERRNRTLLDMFPPPHTNFGKGKKPNLEHLSLWGSVGFVHSTTHKYGKLGPRARKHIFIRYSDSSKGYVMYGEHPNGGMTEIESRDIDFIETDFHSIGDANRDLDLYELEEDEGTLPSSSEGGGLVPRPVIAEDSGSGLQPSGNVDEPASFSEALHSPDRDEWMTAMQEEMSSMDKNNVWELVDLPPRRKTIGNKWVLKVKRKADGSIDRYKARLVAKSYTQREGIDYEDTFSPVSRDMSAKCVVSNVPSMVSNSHLGNAGNDMDSIVTTKKWLSSTFEMKDMVGMVSRYQSNPGPAHWRAVKRIPRDKDERKSTSGYAFILGGGAVSWCSKKQSCIALSTMESEYVACSAAVQEAVWLRRFLQCLGVTAHAEDAVLLYSDSTSALAYAKDPKYHGKAKHIEFRYHYIRDMVSQGEVILQHISTSSMVADPLTKPIARDLFFSHTKSMGLRRI
uniref:Integrase catalytic domain-containing protein n=1 Tax=Fagus sylvatica TaxID=28930 RepID=A0A2N9HH17_FAGSY